MPGGGPRRNDPGMVWTDREGTAAACCGGASRGGEVDVAWDGRRVVATASEASCPELLALPGGMFTMGSTERRYREDGEGPPRTVHVDAFRIAAHVSTARQS